MVGILKSFERLWKIILSGVLLKNRIQSSFSAQRAVRSNLLNGLQLYWDVLLIH